MICLRVSSRDGSFSDQKKLIFDDKEKSIKINDQTIEYKRPIGLQIFSNYLYLYLNPQTIVAVNGKNLVKVVETLTFYKIPTLKIPNQYTQMRASQENINAMVDRDLLVHCGTFNYFHDCFITVKFLKEPSLQFCIKNQLGNSLLEFVSKNPQDIQFYDSENRICVGADYFYFWKELQYFECKYKVQEYFKKHYVQHNNIEVQDLSEENYDMNEMNEQVVTYMPKFESKQMQTDPCYISYEPIYSEYTGKKQNVYYEEMQDQTIRKQKKWDRVGTTRRKSFEIEEQNNEMQNINKSNNRMQMLPIRLNMDELVKREQNHIGQIDPQDNNYLLMVKENELKKRIKEQFSTQVSCQYGENILDIKKSNQKYYLFSHRFQNLLSDQATPKQIIELTHIGQNNEPLKIKPTKLIFDGESRSAFYNDEGKPYIHCYNFKKKQLFHYFVKFPVLDMVKHKSNCFLAIHSNIIFEFDTLTGVKREIAKYKSVHNLTKISAVLDQYFYATASADGMVRTYDIRNHNKALNKFQMDVGITELQVSTEANYILCRYGHRGQIISCTDKNNESVFKSRVLFNDRKKSKNLVKGYQNLFHLQFIRRSDNREGLGDIMAVDDANPCNLVLRNIELNTSRSELPLKFGTNQIDYLSLYDNSIIIYGKKGLYFKQKAPWVYR